MDGSLVHHALRLLYMAAAFALAVVQDTLERLDSYQDGDYSGILLRLEYLHRILINCGDLPDSVVAGIGSAITCLWSAQRSSVPCTHTHHLLTGRQGCPPFDILIYQRINSYSL